MTQVGQVSVGLGLDDKEFNKKIKDAEKKTMQFAGIMKKALGAVGLGFSVKMIVDGISKSVEAFRVQERAVNQLNKALVNSGQYSDEYSRHLQDLASELQKVTNYGDEVTIKAISIGQAFAGNVRLTDDLIRATLDFASATGTDLDTAFKLVGKSIGSNTNAFKRYGIELEKGLTNQQKMIAIQEQLSARFGGTAQAMVNKTEQLKNAYGDLTEKIGSALNPAVEKLQDNLIKTLNDCGDLADKVKDPLNVQLNIWADTLNAVITSLKGVRDFIGALIPGTNNFSAAVLNLSNQFAKLGLVIQYALAPLQVLQKDKTFKDVAESYRKITAQWRGLNDAYFNLLTNNKYKPLLTGELPSATTGSTGTGGNGSGGTGSGSATKKQKEELDERLENYQSFIEDFKQATNEYNATLKARKKLEQQGIGLDNVDYNNILNALKEYELKVTEIKETNTYKRAELLKRAEEKLQQDLQLIALNTQDQTEKKQIDALKRFEEERRKIEIGEQAYKEAGGFLGSFGSGFDERVRILEQYYETVDQIVNDNELSLEQKQEQIMQAQLNRELQFNVERAKLWRDRGHEVQQIFENTFSEMLVNYGDFSDNMRQLALNLTNYMIKQALEEAMKLISIEKMKQAAIMATGLLKKAFGGIAGLFMHSGGMVLPTSKHHYGGMEVPDQTEHFALLKNNERVLSPSETSAYNQNESNNPNYIVYAPQVRAMDSKDVAEWFNENKNQIIGIISNGIRDNKQGLRTQIQGV